MSLIIDENGTISVYQGDSGEIVLSGLDNTKNYNVYFAVQKENRTLIGQELQVSTTHADTATFVLTPSFTDLLTVPANKPYEIYYYGIKACESNTTKEDTLFVSDGTFGDLNRIIVYPRKVQGA